jgi:hypothetical protein
MTEFNSRVSKDEYEIIFKTDKWSDYTEVQEAIRGIIDRNRSQSVSRNTDVCVCCGAEIPEGRQVCPVCENGEDK